MSTSALAQKRKSICKLRHFRDGPHADIQELAPSGRRTSIFAYTGGFLLRRDRKRLVLTR
jgi:hypothetical protein